MEELRIGIVGSRRRNTYSDSQLVRKIIEDAVRCFPDKKVVIVSGACSTGADNMAAFWCKTLDVVLEEYPVEKEPPITSRYEYMVRAYARNLTIAQNSHVLFALAANDRKGGTENTIRHMKNLGKRVFVVDETGHAYLEHGLGQTDKT